MNTQNLAFFSRADLERAVAGLLFGATLMLVAGGAFAMALSSVFAA